MDATVDNVSACAVRIVPTLLTLLVEISGRQSQSRCSPNFPTHHRLFSSVDLQQVGEGRGTNPTFDVA